MSGNGSGDEFGFEITEDEAKIYDRQIRLWGLDAQKRLIFSALDVLGEYIKYLNWLELCIEQTSHDFFTLPLIITDWEHLEFWLSV